MGSSIFRVANPDKTGMSHKKVSYPQHMNDSDYAHINVVKYLDMNTEVIDGKLQPFNIKKLVK